MSSLVPVANAPGAEDARFMALALELGRRGLGRSWPNPAVGAVVVATAGNHTQIVGRGWTQPGGRPHAETEALRRAGQFARGGTLYVTLEPCSHHGKTPPCADTVIAAGISRVVSALVDPNPSVAGAGHWRMAERGIVVDVGVGADEARRAHAGHIRRMRDGRPHVTLKLAVSADGKAGLAGHRPAMITGEAARERVQLMRAMNDAVLTGIGTVHADDPKLNCRLNGMINRSPVRVVLDSGLKLPVSSQLAMMARKIPLWVITSVTAPAMAEQALRASGVEVMRIRTGEDGLDLRVVMQLLGDRGITRVMVEAGPRVSAAFLRADLVDEAVLFRGSDKIGADGLDALNGMPLTALTRSPSLKSLGVEPIGADQVELFERV
ncbi:MAG: bifunctional diaminohydroxyphosphoribosylaminopyrimidine deaminase/5-amino-6-(5-phosphoribosylamino)uracil reductase RibD [Rhizobiales bacterium]|nr:bifunctional diaminohydroxyphosphoribosylaminopyrimidine deaminase/5-amino-6-(5-phosphoribosylamino)uracil reductase RibD [Hyphomicrobiales bacterium]